MTTSNAGGDQVYATLLLSDSYLPGALVLAHSLRDAGTQHQLAVLVTLDSVSADSITQLRTVYDHVFPVPRIRNDHPANLYLMNRGDLHSAFTKINLWKLTQFSKIVYIDADVVAYRAPEELFAISQSFAAAPDIGWPDLFNTGVMVLTPNMSDFYAMIAMAERGISFDGADQGLINMHFGSHYHRLSFTYNVTPSAHYQYVPAYRHFQSSINMVHFIGSNKPWFSGRNAPRSSGPFNEMIGRWWAVYDRHYRHQETTTQARQSSSEYVQYFTKGEWQPKTSHEQQQQQQQQRQEQEQEQQQQQQQQTSGIQYIQEHETPAPIGQTSASTHQENPAPIGQTSASTHQETPAPGPAPQASTSASHSDNALSVDDEHHQAHHSVHKESERHSHGAPPQEPKIEPRQITMHTWDAQRQPPPADSKPEAENFPSMVYEMSRDTAPFVPPKRYPSPPKNMWYDVPKAPPAYYSKPALEIFPWERNRPRATRTFVEPPEPPSPEPQPVAADSMASNEASAGRAAEASSAKETKSEPSTPATPTLTVTPADPWTSFTRVNAWDEMPEIGRYVDGLRGKSPGKSPESGGRAKSPVSAIKGGRGRFRARGMKLTDFPSAIERPSLPVTPAPIQRSSHWGGGKGEGDDEGPAKLPEAKGVPAQSDWDPVAQLQQLAKQQSDALLQKLGGVVEGTGDEGDSTGASHEIPTRPLPFGSDNASSPTYVAQSAPGVLSPQPVKGERSMSILRSINSGSFEHVTSSQQSSIPEPSYTGPGAAWERGEDIPNRETPLLPRDEDRDILDT